LKRLYYTFIDTPIGQLLAYATDAGLYLLAFTDDILIEKKKQLIQNLFDTSIEQNDHLPIFLRTKNVLNDYFSGKAVKFDLPIVLLGTPFQQSVYRQLMQIPYGSVMSYKQQAQILKSPLAIRAIASTNGSNLINIIIPCHRVVGSTGKLTGYSGGLHRKEYLLSLEQKEKQLEISF